MWGKKLRHSIVEKEGMNKTNKQANTLVDIFLALPEFLSEDQGLPETPGGWVSSPPESSLGFCPPEKGPSRRVFFLFPYLLANVC